MLMWSSGADLPDPNVPHVTASADDRCLALKPGRAGEALAFAASRTLAGCATTRLPLLHDKMLGSNRLFGDLEFTNVDIGEMTADEVKLKFGLSRELVAGLHATIDGSIGRVLGQVAPMFDGQLHVGLNKALDAHWETGLEGRVGALGSLGATQLTERSGLVFVRARYSIFTDRGDEHRAEVKLSADAWQGTGQPLQRHARADMRYEYHHDNNILSVGFNITESEPHAGGGNPSFRLDLRAMRRF